MFVTQSSGGGITFHHIEYLPAGVVDGIADFVDFVLIQLDIRTSYAAFARHRIKVFRRWFTIAGIHFQDAHERALGAIVAAHVIQGALHEGVQLAAGRVVGHAFKAAVRLAFGVLSRQSFNPEGPCAQPSCKPCANRHVSLDQLTSGTELVDRGSILITDPNVAILVLDNRFQVGAVGVVGQQIAACINGDLIAFAVRAAADRGSTILLGQFYFADHRHHTTALIQGDLVVAGLVVGQQEGLHQICSAVGAGGAIGLHHILAGGVSVGPPVCGG